MFTLPFIPDAMHPVFLIGGTMHHNAIVTIEVHACCIRISEHTTYQLTSVSVHY
jgi:hypothetical protein